MFHSFRGSVVFIKTRNSVGLSFLSAADFGDFSRYDSQDFLQKFVLFPIVSSLFYFLLVCLSLKWQKSILHVSRSPSWMASAFYFCPFFAGLDPGWASAWRGHSESGSSLPVVQVDAVQSLLSCILSATVDLFSGVWPIDTHTVVDVLFSQGFVSPTGWDAVHAGSRKIRRLRPGELPGQGQFIKVEPPTGLFHQLENAKENWDGAEKNWKLSWFLWNRTAQGQTSPWDPAWMASLSSTKTAGPLIYSGRSLVVRTLNRLYF